MASCQEIFALLVLIKAIRIVLGSKMWKGVEISINSMKNLLPTNFCLDIGTVVITYVTILKGTSNNGLYFETLRFT